MENWVVEDPPSQLNGKFHFFKPPLKDPNKIFLPRKFLWVKVNFWTAKKRFVD